jgi:response regulator RpfG family c-di-GMP phosphodiesterase
MVRRYRVVDPTDTRVLLIDSCQATRDARTQILKAHGIEVHTAENLEEARFLWRPDFYNLVLLDVRRYLPGEALDFCRLLKDISPQERIAFLLGAPRYLSLTWPEEIIDIDQGQPHWNEMVRRLAAAA